MIAERVAAVRERIARSASRAGRSDGEVTLVAVSKTHPSEAIREAFAAGVRDFGENKVQEAEKKVGALADLRGEGLRWHMVGHLQANKARKAVALFDRIHSVDDPELGPRLEKAAAERKKIARVLLQVDLAHEDAKFGLEEARVFPALEVLRGLKSVRVEGLMVFPPYEADPERVRPFFRRLRELRDQARARQLLLGDELSMGMSHDLEVAVEEGATLVRVGTAVFGERAG
ncbi:MAG TPA: YggS family pyridoxal phosphate-dependent enzyme [Vicinamibacteria bacterium]|nr:YggS family pyridoxal phosphate-dependent enzyme [Vicinamibacteria bacterium]